MPGLEIHTLNQVETELPSALLVRAVDTARGIDLDAQDKAPEYPGALSLDGPDIYSVLGDKLPDIHSQIEKKERLANYPVALGSLASKASISATTGCWSVVEAWRNDSGYAFVWDPEEYGYEIDRDEKFRGVLLHRMAYNIKRRVSGLPDLTSKEQLDHVCRWPGCCNIDHLNIVDHKTNSKLRDLARYTELMIASGQIMIGPVGIGWLDERLATCQNEDTNIIITTHLGPFRIHKLDDDPLMFVAKAEKSGLLEIVKPAAPKKYVKPSQSKNMRVHDFQDKLLSEEDYDGLKSPKLSKPKLYKHWQKTGGI